MIIEEIKQIKSSNKDIINFALLIGGLIAVIGFVTMFYKSAAYMYLIPFGFVFMLIGFILPVILKPIYFLWMTISVILGFISTRIILGVLFYIVITPISIITKLMGKDLLNIKFNKSESTYWIKRENSKYEKIETERQF